VFLLVAVLASLSAISGDIYEYFNDSGNNSVGAECTDDPGF
jgi:hypothetical protein